LFEIEEVWVHSRRFVTLKRGSIAGVGGKAGTGAYGPKGRSP